MPDSTSQTPAAGADGLRFRDADLSEFTAAVLRTLGVPPGDAKIAAESLIEADLMGIDSHGVAHLPWHPGYVKGLQRGWVNPAPVPIVEMDGPSTALLDGDGGMGVIVAHAAQELAIDKAAVTGIGAVAVRNSRHFGAASVWSLKAARAGMIGIVFSNGGPIVVPANGRRPMLGTNPISIAAPASPHPFLLDCATSVVAGGKLEIAQREGAEIPLGWALEPDGTDTTDPSVLRRGGALLPLGSDAGHSWHKGYGLGLACELLAGVLSGGGTSWGSAAPALPMGHLHLAMKIQAFGDLSLFIWAASEAARDLRESQPRNPSEPVRVPGDREFESRLARLKSGIPLHSTVVRQLNKVGNELGVPFPSPVGREAFK